jgi:hypothetical protein
VLAAGLLMAGAAIAALSGGGNDRSAARASTTSKKPAAPKRKAGSTSVATATAAPATTSAGAPADAAAIQASAHAAIGQGDYTGAVEQLKGLVERCDVQITSPCAWAWFDLGYALRRAGSPELAVPVLEHRLDNPDQSATVQAELDAARAEAGAGSEIPGSNPDGKAKGKGHFKPGKGD